MLSNPGQVLVLLASIAAQSQVVLAGSRVFQPRITKYDHPGYQNTYNALDGTIVANITEAQIAATNAHSPSKRYLIDNASRAKLWPKNTVRYCFDSADTKTALFNNLKDALDRWWASGLDQSVFKWEEVSDDECKNERSVVLLINRGPTNNGHSASVGFKKAEADSDHDGPSMTIDDGDWGSYDNKIGSFAHEIGHVWGLYHEHQNPNFWREDSGVKGALGGSVFGTSNFNCKAIKGYDAAVQCAEDEFGPMFVKEVCTSQTLAKYCGFLAWDFLPYPSDNVLSQPGHGVDDVDWDSIMIYPSDAGSTDPNTPIITKPDGSLIKDPYNPTARDVLGVNKLYSSGPQTQEELLNQKSNPKSNLFRSIYAKGNGGSSC